MEGKHRVQGVVAFLAIVPCFAVAQLVPPERTLPDWKYPGAFVVSTSGGANPLGEQTQAVMITDDRFETVVAHYKKALDPPTSPSGDVVGGAAAWRADTIVVQKDSAGRPLEMCVIVAHLARGSFTAVVTRGAEEKQTHIAVTRHKRTHPVTLPTRPDRPVDGGRSRPPASGPGRD